jgi:hypothetical protein
MHKLMSAVLTFVIPILHPENSWNWMSLKQHVAQTIRSISQQTSDRWNAVIVANHGSDLPDTPGQFEVKWVAFPPNSLYDRDAADNKRFYDAVRWNKGLRVLAGMLHAQPKGHVMVVDHDDLISNRLVSFVARNEERNGWYIKNGYIWSEGVDLLYCYSDFSQFCGSSHIIRADLYQLPSSIDHASEDYVRRIIGSHVLIREHLANNGAPLAHLPFRGAIYRMGHIG